MIGSAGVAVHIIRTNLISFYYLCFHTYCFFIEQALFTCKKKFRDFHVRMLRMMPNIPKTGLEKIFVVSMIFMHTRAKGRKNNESIVIWERIELSSLNSAW